MIDDEKAIEPLTKPLEDKDEDVRKATFKALTEVLVKKRMALGELKQYEEALKSFDKALTMNSKFADAFLEKGVVLYELSRYKEALECYYKALAIDPKYAAAWLNKGMALHELE